MVDSHARYAKLLLSGNNRWSKSSMPVHTFHGKPPHSFAYGEQVAHAADRARYWLGYPKSMCNTGRYGDQLRSYLVPKASRAFRPLPKTYALRRYLRVRAEKKRLADLNSKKLRALSLARTQIGIHESPYGSNRQKFGEWFGFNGVPWCAEFVSYCMGHSGFTFKTALAFQFEYWARGRQYGLSITYNPQPGDIVVYHHNAGHVGIFEGWTNRSAGQFRAVEGNTSVSSQDNGGEVMRRDRDTGWVPTIFVRVP